MHEANRWSCVATGEISAGRMASLLLSLGAWLSAVLPVPAAVAILRTSNPARHDIPPAITTILSKSYILSPELYTINYRMESEILKIADLALSQPDIIGYICVDQEGLCLAAKGQVQQSISGIIHQIATLANKIEEPTKSHHNGSKSGNESVPKPPIIRVDLDKSQMIIQQRDSITTALISSRK